MKLLHSTTVLAFILSTSSLMAEDITLRYMSWDTEQIEVEKPLIAQFEESHPGVKVEVQVIPSDKGYWPKLTAQAVSGDLPDVFMMSSGFIKEWGVAGNLLDLNSYVDEAALGKYYQGATDTGVVNGERVAFPQNWVAPVLYYNVDMFEEAGVPLPTADWTWNDFLDAAKKLTIDEDSDGKPEQWGMSLYGRYAHVDTWVFRNGGRYLNADETQFEINDAAKNTLKFLTDLVLVEKVAPMPSEMEGIRQQDIFPMGMAAMWVDGSWNIANTREIAGDNFKWDIAQVPAGPDATPETEAAYAWADMLSVAKTSEHPDIAWEFINFMTGPGRSPSDFLGGKVPAFKAIAEDPAWLEADQQPAHKGLILEIGNQSTYSGFSKNWSAWRGYDASGVGGMNGELDEVFNGRKSIDDALAAITSYANESLSQ